MNDRFSRRLIGFALAGLLLLAGTSSAQANREESDVRPDTPPKAPAFPLPVTLKIADGELRIGALLQAWYVADDSAEGSGTGYLGNTTGINTCLLYTSPSPRDRTRSRMPSSA